MLPEPPVNVRLLYANNAEVPVDTVYVGIDKDGVHQWQIINSPQALQVTGMNIDSLPPRTSVIFDLGMENG